MGPSSTVLRTALVLIALCVSLGGAHRCIHDSLERSSKHLVFTEQDSASAAARRHGLQADTAATTSPIRIIVKHLWETNAAADKNMCKKVGDTVIVDGSSYQCTAADLLDAQRSQQIKSDVTNAVKVLTSALKVIPFSSNLIVANASCTAGPTFIPMVDPADFGAGVAAADYVLYVTTWPNPPGVLAYALACQFDKTSSRPIVGHANFGPSNVNVGDAGSYLVALHEIIHALGFSASLFPYFRDPSNPAKAVASAASVVNPSSGMMITPKVKEVVQRHFQCSNTALGAPMENDGDKVATAGSHWEKEYFLDEFMTGSKGAYPYYSKLTFAALHDSGWYVVDFTVLPDLTYGLRRGCGFISKCTDLLNDPKLSRYVCPSTDNLQLRCSAEGTAKAYCHTVQLAACLLPVSSPSNEFYACSDPRSALSTKIPALAIEAFSNSSSCFIGNNRPRCFEWGCMGPWLQVKLGTKDYIVCKAAGPGTIPAAQSGTLSSFTCPDPAEYCDQTQPTPSLAPAATPSSFTPASPQQVNSVGAPPPVIWPVLDSIDPSSGNPETVMTLQGDSFTTTTKVVLAAGDSCASMSYVNTQQITCKLPAKFVIGTSVQVTVAEGNRTSTLGPNSFRVVKVDTLQDTVLNGANEAGKAAVSTWKKINSACGKNFPCWAIPVILICLGLLILWGLCCSKSKKKNDERDKLPPNQMPPMKANPYGANPGHLAQPRPGMQHPHAQQMYHKNAGPNRV